MQRPAQLGKQIFGVFLVAVSVTFLFFSRQGSRKLLPSAFIFFHSGGREGGAKRGAESGQPASPGTCAATGRQLSARRSPTG
jgi:hypothetical protein